MPRRYTTSYATSSRRGGGFYTGHGTRVRSAYKAVRPTRGLSYRTTLRSSYKKKNARYGGFMARDLKYTDKILTSNPVGTSLTNANLVVTEPLNGIAVGTSQTDRIGNKTLVKSIMFRGHLTALGNEGAAGVLTQTDNVCKLVCFVDHQANAAGPDIDTLFEDASDIHSFRDQENIERYTVLYNKLFYVFCPMTSINATKIACTDHTYRFSYYKKCNILCRHTTTDADYSDISSNSISLFAMRRDTFCSINLIGVSRCTFQG